MLTISAGGNTLSNGLGKALDAPSCNMACVGDKTTTCGGSWALSLFATGAGTAAAPPAMNSTAAISGFTAAGCRADLVGGKRTLNVDAFTSATMTLAACVAHCDARGHALAGVEYSRECYCGDAFANGGGAPIADSTCDMACGGDATTMCGGPAALTVFVKQGSDALSTAAKASSKRAHKARHFGRAHMHSDMF